MNVKKQIKVSYNVTDNGEAVESCSALSRVISYIPYGEIFVEQQSGAWQSPYLFNAKELDSETGLYYYGARYLDPSEGMWLSVDPLFEKYVGMSPYGYCAGNPVRLVDVDGRDTFVFDNEGNYSHKIVADGEHVGRYSGKTNVDFKFADPINDPKAIDNGDINRIEIKTYTEIDNALWNSGVYNEENQTLKKRYSFAKNESSVANANGTGKMDYVFTANFDRSDKQMVLNIDDFENYQEPLLSNVLYITKTKSGFFAHNDHNFGNFLWGAGMNALGFSEMTARCGAHWNNFWNDLEPYHLDSSDDQLSIKLGFEWKK